MTKPSATDKVKASNNPAKVKYFARDGIFAFSAAVSSGFDGASVSLFAGSIFTLWTNHGWEPFDLTIFCDSSDFALSRSAGRDARAPSEEFVFFNAFLKVISGQEIITEDRAFDIFAFVM